MRLLLERSASVNHANDTGHTPLMFAVIKGCEACVGLLCAHGAAREARTHEKGISAADYARKLKRPAHAQIAAYLDGTLERLGGEDVTREKICIAHHQRAGPSPHTSTWPGPQDSCSFAGF